MTFPFGIRMNYVEDNLYVAPKLREYICRNNKERQP